MSVKSRCKVYVQSVTIHGWGEVINFAGVMDDGIEENKRFNSFTPNISMTISITNEALLGKYRPDQYYYVDFTPTEKYNSV